MDKKLRMQLIMSAMDKVTNPLKKIQGGSTATAKALKTTNDRLKDLQARQKQVGQFRELRTGMRATSADLLQAQNRVNSLAREIDQTANPTRAMTREFNAAKRTADALKQKVESQGNKLHALRTKLSAAGISTRNLSRHERTLRRDINETTSALKRQQERMSKINAARNRLHAARARSGQLAGAGARMMAAGVVTGAPVAASVGEYAKAEDSATMLKVALMQRGGVVPETFERINTLAMRLGDKLPGATSDFQDMMTMLRRQGISAESILGGMGKATAYLGVQLKKTPAEAAEFAAKMQDATRTTEKNMMGLMDIIQRTFYLGVEDNNMLMAFTKLSPAMDILRMKGIAAAKVMAPLIVMADQAGMRGEASGNAYRKIFQLSMDGSKVAKANKLMGGAGSLDFTDGKGEFGGLKKMFQQLQKLKNLNTQTRQAVIKSIFGDDAETLQAVTIMMSKGIDGYREVEGRMAAQASLQKRVNVQLGTLRNLWDAASGTFINGLVAFGESIAPEVKAIAEWLGRLAEKMGAWARENPRLAGTLMKITAVLAGLLTIGGALTLTVAGVLVPLAALKLSMATLGIQSGILAGTLGAVRTAVLFVGRAIMMNPIGLLVTGLAVAGYLVYRHWNTIKTAFADAIEWFKGLRDQFFSFGKNIIQGLLAGIKAGTGAVLGKMKSVAADIAETFQASMGIHSPSRLFAQYGDFTMQGLAQGLDRRADLPLQKVSAMAGRMKQIGAGIAIGAASLPAGAFDTRPPIAGQKAPTAISSSNTYQIHVHAAPGMDENALARAVARELDKRDREKAAQRRSSLIDYDD